jgi:hypothetical protein
VGNLIQEPTSPLTLLLLLLLHCFLLLRLPQLRGQEAGFFPKLVYWHLEFQDRANVCTPAYICGESTFSHFSQHGTSRWCCGRLPRPRRIACGLDCPYCRPFPFVHRCPFTRGLAPDAVSRHAITNSPHRGRSAKREGLSLKSCQLQLIGAPATKAQKRSSHLLSLRTSSSAYVQFCKRALGLSMLSTFPTARRHSGIGAVAYVVSAIKVPGSSRKRPGRGRSCLESWAEERARAPKGCTTCCRGQESR